MTARAGQQHFQILLGNVLEYFDVDIVGIDEAAEDAVVAQFEDQHQAFVDRHRHLFQSQAVTQPAAQALAHQIAAGVNLQTIEDVEIDD